MAGPGELPMHHAPGGFGDPGASSSNAPRPPSSLATFVTKPCQAGKSFEAIEIRRRVRDHFALWIVRGVKNDADQLWPRLYNEQFPAWKLHSSSNDKMLLGRGMEDVHLANCLLDGVVVEGETVPRRDVVTLSRAGSLAKVVSAMRHMQQREDCKWVVFVDEADATWNVFFKVFVPHFIMAHQIFLVFITATPDESQRKLWGILENLGVALHRNTGSLDHYHPLKEAVWKLAPFAEAPEVDGDIVALTKYALEVHRDTYPSKRPFGFVPALVKIGTHHQTAKALVRAVPELVVLVINGEGYTVYFSRWGVIQREVHPRPNPPLVDYTDSDDDDPLPAAVDVGEKLVRKFAVDKDCPGVQDCKIKLCGCRVRDDFTAILDFMTNPSFEWNFEVERPFAVTGHLCLGRSSTLHDADMPFSFCVASSHLLKNASGRVSLTHTFCKNLYQLMGRIAGGFAMDPPIVVYNDEKLRESVIVSEGTVYELLDMENPPANVRDRIQEARKSAKRKFQGEAPLDNLREVNPRVVLDGLAPHEIEILRALQDAGGRIRIRDLFREEIGNVKRQHGVVLTKTMRNKGLVENSTRGIWALTQLGKDVVQLLP